MKVKLTKKFVISALMSEIVPTPGRWVSISVYDGTYVSLRTKTVTEVRDDKTCVRCAVGAVVLTALDGRTSADTASDIAEYAARSEAGRGALTQEQVTTEAVVKLNDRAEGPFAALSFFFESRARDLERGTGLTPKRRLQLRDETVAFVQAHFPEKVTLDMNGYDAKFKPSLRPKRKAKTVRK